MVCQSLFVLVRRWRWRLWGGSGRDLGSRELSSKCLFCRSCSFFVYHEHNVTLRWGVGICESPHALRLYTILPNAPRSYYLCG
jgi:hypothetical protein